MPKGNPNPVPRKPTKPHKVKSIKLADRLVPFTEGSLDNATATIELGQEVLIYLADQSLRGDDRATSLLAYFGVEAATKSEQPIIVYRQDGEVAAWIC